MALKPLAVSGMVLEIVSTLPSDNVTGTVTVTSIASLKTKVTGSGVYVHGCGVSVSGITAPGAGATIPDPSPKTGSINATTTKTKSEGSYILRVDDETGIINATPSIPSTPSPISYPTSFKIRISNAGQTKVKSL